MPTNTFQIQNNKSILTSTNVIAIEGLSLSLSLSTVHGNTKVKIDDYQLMQTAELFSAAVCERYGRLDHSVKSGELGEGAWSKMANYNCLQCFIALADSKLGFSPDWLLD